MITLLGEGQKKQPRGLNLHKFIHDQNFKNVIVTIVKNNLNRTSATV
jgi:hypothetical protein